MSFANVSGVARIKIFKKNMRSIKNCGEMLNLTTISHIFKISRSHKIF